jgi:hypothetical protein
VLGEVRIGAHLPVMSVDCFEYRGPMDNWKYDKQTPAWKSSCGITEDNSRHFSHLTSNTINITSEEAVNHYSKNFWGDGEDHYPAMKSFLDVYTMTYGTSWAYQSSFYEIVTMYEYCRVIGVPYYWFTMNSSGKSTIGFWYEYIVDSLKVEYKDVYESNLLDNKDLINYMGFNDINSTETKCECGHLDEQYQPQIAQILFDRINTILHK